MRRHALLLAIALIAHAAAAGTELPVPLVRGTEAKIAIGIPFDYLPPGGYAPLDIKVENSSAEPHTWTFDFSTSEYGLRQRITSRVHVLVPAKSARTSRALIPLAVDGQVYGSPLSVRVSGFGAHALSTIAFPAITPTGKQLTPFIGMSEALHSRFGSAIEGELDLGGPGDVDPAAAFHGQVLPPHPQSGVKLPAPVKFQLARAKFRPAELPEDWRAFIGFAAIWLTADEAAQLSAAQRNALRDWVHRGGRLFISGKSETVAELPQVGFGKVETVAPDLDPAAIAASIRKLRPTLEELLSDHYTRGSSWQARNAVGEIEVNAPLLIGFIVLFAGLSGPANLFWLAPAGRRHRLFWTTPAISLGAGLGLALLIVFHDGFGGTGHRLALVHLLPAERKQVVLQEQIARTAVVPSSVFTTREATFIAPIALEAPGVGSPPEVEIADRQFDGLFKSRAMQAQWLESIVSTRAEVALLNAAEVRDKTAPPTILSSINAPLEELWFVDEHGGVWSAKNVRAGEKVTLEQTAPRLLLPEQAGPRLRSMWEAVQQQPGHFYATSRDPAPLIDTLPSIRWEQQRALYFGPVTSARSAP